jgi:hypothetical protein
VVYARDRAIRSHEIGVEGRSRALGIAERHSALVSLTEEQPGIVRREVVNGIDAAIHHLLWLFEQHDVNGFDVMFRGTDEVPPSARSASRT